MQVVQLAFPLRQPERLDWQRDAHFEESVHTQLLAAHRRVTQSTPEADARPEVERQLMRLRGAPMSQRQEMLLNYLLAQCARARDLGRSTHFIAALGWCSRAEQIAGALLDYGAQVDLHELRGTLHRAVSLYWMAAEEFALALHLLREHAEDSESFDPEFEVTLIAKTAAMDYLIGAYPRALEYVTRAATLLPLTTMSVNGQGTVAWTLALLHQQRNELMRALHQVEIATALYRQMGATNSTCRVLSLAADIALELAESSSGDTSTAYGTYLAKASNYIEEAQQVGEQAHDVEGLALAALSRAWLNRLCGAPAGAAHPEAMIRDVLRQARQLRDDSLLTEAQTALGIELLTQGKTAVGKRWLEKAIATAAGINAPGLAFRAQRSLPHADGSEA